MTEYRIILIPKNKKDIDLFYNITNTYKVTNIASTYLLQEHRSLPHITISKIYTEEDNLKDVFDKIKNVSIPSFKFIGLTILNKLPIEKFAYLLIKGAGIKQLHREISSLVNTEGDIDEFTPHLSLFSTKEVNDSIITGTLNDYSFVFSNSIEFKIAIGTTDKYGQVEKILID